MRPLGRGAFAQTFLARDDAGGRLVALKTLYGRPQADLKSYELFEREAQVLLGLRHEGIPAFVELLRADVAGTPATFLDRIQ